MAPNIKRVFYVNHVSAPIFLEMLGQRPDIQVDKLVNDSPEDEVEPVLARAHAYQIGSARQELARKFHGTAALLERMPNVVVLSTTGAGYDTVNLEDCTRAGVAAVNQAGGNKEGVAEHVMAMMLSLSKRLMLADHSMRSGEQLPRREFMGDDVVDRTIGIIGLGNVGSRVAELCRGLFRMRVLAYDPYLTEAQMTRTRRGEDGGAGRSAAPGGLRVDQLPAHRGDARHDRRARIRADAAARLFHHHRARRHPRRGGVGRGAAREADRRCGAGCLGGRAAADRPSAAGIRQRAGQSAHRRHHAAVARTTSRRSRQSN